MSEYPGYLARLHRNLKDRQAVTPPKPIETAQEVGEPSAKELANAFCDEMIQNLRHNVGKPEAAPAEAIQDLGPLNARDQSAIAAGCNCARKMPYMDWSHAKTCPLYFETKKPESPQAERAQRLEQLYDEGPRGMWVRKWKPGEEPAELQSQPSSLAGTFEDNRLDLLKEVSKRIKRAWQDASSESQSDLDEAQGMLMAVIHNPAWAKQSQPVIEPLREQQIIATTISDLRMYMAASKVKNPLTMIDEFEQQYEQFRKAQQERRSR